MQVMYVCMYVIEMAGMDLERVKKFVLVGSELNEETYIHTYLHTYMHACITWIT